MWWRLGNRTVGRVRWCCCVAPQTSYEMSQGNLALEAPICWFVLRCRNEGSNLQFCSWSPLVTGNEATGVLRSMLRKDTEGRVVTVISMTNPTLEFSGMQAVEGAVRFGPCFCWSEQIKMLLCCIINLTLTSCWVNYAFRLTDNIVVTFMCLCRWRNVCHIISMTILEFK